MQRDSVLHADVLIIGAGAAGITLARALRHVRATTLLLESGGFEGEKETLELADGLNSKTEYPVDETPAALLRGYDESLGWLVPADGRLGVRAPALGGRCRLADRPRRSRRLLPACRAASSSYRPIPRAGRGTGPTGVSNSRSGSTRRCPETDITTGAMFRFSPPTRFGTTYRKELHDAANVTVVLHANVFELRTNETASRSPRFRWPRSTATGSR